MIRWVPNPAHRPAQRRWARLDNASNIFLAARSPVDSKVFRLSAELDRDVHPGLLQQALEGTYARYPLYSSVLRRGVFWYYLQDSDLRPTVRRDVLPPCAPLYQPDTPSLLFRVIHHGRRISLEVFHALSDGTGALWFLTDLLATYAALREPGVAAPASEDPAAGAEPQALTGDSFANYFRRGRGEARTPLTRRRTRDRAGRVYRVKGTHTPDLRTRLVELTLPAAPVLALARAENVSMTMYLVAVFFECLVASAGGLEALGRARRLGVSVPVNLRQAFPSASARNFFAAVRLEHTYGEGPDDVGTVARALEAEFRPRITPEALETSMRRFARFERMSGLRVIPRPLKDAVLGLINRANNRGLTAAISNLGRVNLTDPAEQQVGKMALAVSAVRPQLCVVSHAGELTLSFTSPFVQTDHIRRFARFLTQRGIPVSVAATAVTEDEIVGTSTGEGA